MTISRCFFGGLTDFFECGPVGMGRLRVMDGAWPDDHEEPMLVSSIEDIPDGLTGLQDRGFCGRGDRQLFPDLPRGHQFFDFNDVSIIKRFIHENDLPEKDEGLQKKMNNTRTIFYIG